MNKLIGVVVLVVVAVAAYMYLTPDPKATEESVQNQSTTYSSADLGFSFDYRPGPAGYVLEERMPGESESGLERTIILMSAADHERMTTNPPVGGEGPPVIAIHVLKNAKKQFPLAWANENTPYSNINLKTGTETEAVVGGANAIRYMADGLYASENIVVAHGDHIYVLTGQFMDQNSDIRRDFQTLVNSIRFIPAPGQS